MNKFFLRLKAIQEVLSDKKSLAIIFIIIYSLIVVWFLGYIVRYGQGKPALETFAWFWQQPVALLVNCLLVGWILSFIWVMFGRFLLSVVVSSIFLAVFCLINYFKQTIRGEPFYPGDLLFSGEAANIIGETKLVIPASIAIFLVVIVLLCLIAFLLKVNKLSLRKRLVVGVLLVSFIILSFPLYFNNQTNQKLFGIEDAIWNQKHNYQKNGPLAAFLMQTSYLTVRRPVGYSNQRATSLLDKNKSRSKASSKPNLIVIMSESFWDPTRLPNVEFNVDPLESFRKIQKESIYGDILVEPFGGNTANSEFEFLMGFSMNSLPGGVAYQQYLKRSVPSLVSLLKDQGYKAEAIHPYYAWFWNRKVVYLMLGFDDFLSLDEFKGSAIKGDFTSDQAVVDKLIQRYEANRSTDKSYFAHVVTMQNHGWYDADRYGDKQVVKANSDRLGRGAIAEVNTYSQGVKDASDSLASLVDYFRNQDEQTDIIFFGDHLPTLGSDYDYYRKTDFVSEGNFNDEDRFKLHSVPFLIWSNYRNDHEDIGLIRANHLAPLFLGMTNLDMTNYFNFLNNLPDDLKACDKQTCYYDGKYLSLDKKRQEIINQETIQYYYLFDKSYN